MLKKFDEKVIMRQFIFLQGEEVYYIDAITQHIEKNILSLSEKSFNLTIFYGKECSMATVLTQARRFPMGANHQVVIVKEAQEMTDLKNTTGQQLLLKYIKIPQSTTLLVFAYKYKVLDGRNAFSKSLEQSSVLVTSKKLYDQQIPVFIKSFVRDLELSITDKAIWMVQECIGNDLTRIANELRKLRINLVVGDTITDQIVEDFNRLI